MRKTVKRIRFRKWEWEVYSSAYGLAYGYAPTRKAAIKRAEQAEYDFLREA